MSPGAAGPLWGDCPPNTDTPPCLGGGTYLRMSLQNSRAVRGQPLFSRNIRCLKRARKKALHGEQQQDLEARCGKKHFVPLEKGDRVIKSSSPPSITSWCGMGFHRAPQLLFLLPFCARTGTENSQPACRLEPRQVNPPSPHPTLSQRCGDGDTERGGPTPELVIQVTDGTKRVSQRD